ncbi:hypothetical protein PoB_002345000 [Plakobranchus ocellatus]|uniref:Uncharacterized protein n=1 Tax=Plakobranchus ocellatus TaxID=259542 RepID=A0AAV3ZP69_9GAST|nr:hypothetical protein PoB_002345000 [Plakobranchus ocellatus]
MRGDTMSDRYFHIQDSPKPVSLGSDPHTGKHPRLTNRPGQNDWCGTRETRSTIRAHARNGLQSLADRLSHSSFTIVGLQDHLHLVYNNIIIIIITMFVIVSMSISSTAIS